MKILMISSYHFLLGGIERVVFETTKMLRDNGHEVIPFAMQDPRNLPSEYDKYFVEQRDISRVSISISNLLTATRMIYNSAAKKSIRALIKEVEPDIAHVHHIYGRLTPAVLIELKNNNIPVVMTLHDYKLACPNYKFFSNGNVCEKCNKFNFFSAILNRCVKKSYMAAFVYCLESYLYTIMKTYDRSIKTFIAPSNFMKQKMIEHGMNGSKLEHLYNFLNLANYTPNFSKKNYALYFGRLTIEKGLLCLIAAMKLNPDINLLIVGTGELEQELKQNIEVERLGNIQFLGFKSGMELSKLISDAKAVIVPSIWYENNPMVVLEAFAYGTPVIGADIGGIPELIQPGKNGYLFKHGDCMDLAQHINQLFKSSDTSIHEMGRFARRYVEEHFNENSHYHKLIDVYMKSINTEPRLVL